MKFLGINFGMDAKPGDVVRKFLVDTKVSDLKAEVQQVTILKDNATVDQALRILAEHKILSCPVVTPPEHDTNDEDPIWPMDRASGDLMSFIDVRDVLCSFLEEINMEEMSAMNMLTKMRFLEAKGVEYGTKQLRDLKQIGFDGDFLHQSQARSSLLEMILYGLLQPKVRGVHGGHNQAHVVHRIAIFDNQGRVSNIISQTDIIRFLERHSKQLGSTAQSTLQELGMVAHAVEVIRPETSAIEAMAVMNRQRISSLAIVDANNKILGNFSVSELRTIMSEHFGALALPVGEFLALEHKVEYVGYNRVHDEGIVGTVGHRFVVDRVSRGKPHVAGEEVGQQLVLCRPQDTLAEVLGQLVRHRIHRIYVVDEAEVPIGIVTCTDVLRKLVQLCE
mmetsp:Transcript_6225/g.13609  ORF Transcript_6225/g.13609 Transcript_6225/m.13609 type:complete len:392 (-) Transcript_6225:740-1915(-)|eukprot:CAMPEP_0202896236 /NCGR_PEP_ID=MMETSP1392-20130828/5265_1 /ASSEMBLY_ACC=CAM_ASM_000868 /TAXON_ID=225041 /ORGANISM="Chlamydomonas chlamydogama, Strain SAG 11-48b" /LENGTH=391 /DNA_ID=CAMNT_0049581505 /DNA_START=150 /DNA_END=1325 /DNA_ORIENTATION=-